MVGTRSCWKVCECAICSGAYEDAVSEDGKLLFSWVECTNPDGKKWMHEYNYYSSIVLSVCIKFCAKYVLIISY